MCNFCCERCLWHSSWHGCFGWSIKGLAVLYVPRHAVKMGCQGLPRKFSIAELMPGALQNFIFLEIVCPIGHAGMSYVTPQTLFLPSWLQESRKCVNSFMWQLFPALVLGSVGQVEEERRWGTRAVSRTCLVGRERCAGTELCVSAQQWPELDSCAWA